MAEHPVRPLDLHRSAQDPHRLRLATTALVSLIVAACSGPLPVPLFPSEAVLSPEARGDLADHVILISFDGLRPDAIDRFRPATLSRLLREGSHTLDAQTIVPSRTLPGHLSMISGEPPTVHGSLHNHDPEETRWLVPVPTIFHLAQNGGFRTAAFFGKRKFRQIFDPTSVGHVEGPLRWPNLRPAWSTAQRVERYLEHARPNLLFVHFAEPDYVGHVFTWMSPPYGWSLQWADQALGRILEAADRAFGPDRYTVILTSDHGGDGFTHGSADPVNTTIPWIAWGRGVARDTELPAGVRTMDTAATVLWILGVPRPEAWAGVPVFAAFQPAVAPVE